MKTNPSLVLAFTVLLFALCGCTTSRESKQDAANAIAGVDALAEITLPGLDRVDAALFTTISDGIKANIAAASKTKQVELPSPSTSPLGVVAQPETYRDAAEEREKAATEGVAWLAWLGGATGIALGILKFIPGAHQPLIPIARMMFESVADKKSREKEEQLAIAARTVIQCVEQYDTEGVIKRAVAKKLPSSAKDVVDAYLYEEGLNL